MRVACAILALCALAFGQAPGTAVVAGTVVEAASGDPVRKASVTLTLEGATPPTYATERTDSSGQFRFEKLPAGKYTLGAAKNGIGTAVYGANGAREAAETITLGDGESRAALKLRFIRTAIVSGRVYDSDGDPVADARIMLQRQTRNLGQAMLANYRGAVTDDRGEYQIANVALGQYHLLLTPNGNGVNGGRLFAPLYFGGTRQWKDSTVLNIRSGEKLTGIDFQLSPEQPYRIAGRIAGVPDLGAPAGIVRMQNQIQVSMSSADEGAGMRSGFGAGALPPDYRFDFENLIGGLYRIDARVETGGRTWAASELIDSRTAGSDVVLELTPAFEISGVLRIEGASQQPAPNPRISLNRAGGPVDGASALPDSTGHFTLRQVTPGEFALNVAPLPRGGFLKSATYGDKDIRFTRFTPQPGSDAQIHVVISMRSAKLEGQIEAEGLDAKRAGIMLAPTGDLHNLARFYYGAVSDDDGKFHLENLAPGKYRVFALEKLAPADFRTPEAADKLNALGEDVELTEGATAEAHPKLIPTERAREALPEE